MTMILTRIRYFIALAVILPLMAVSCEGIGGAGGNAGSPGSPVQENTDDTGDDGDGKTGGESGEETGGGTSQPADSVIRVATYNLLVCDGRRSEMAMNRAGKTLGKVVAACKADIICFNEVDETLAKNVPVWAAEAGATGFSWDMNHPNKVVSGVLEYYYANGLAYRSDKFENLGHGIYWYLTTSKTTASSEDASSHHVSKYCTLVWVRLKHKPTDKVFYVISTHFPLADDGASDGYRKGTMHRICAQALNALAMTLPYPCIVGADFNCSAETGDDCARGYATLCQEWTDCYDQLLSDGKLDNFFKTYSGTLSGSSAKYYYTAEVFTKNHPERRIDHIMYRNAGESFSFVPKTYQTLWTSYTYSGKSWCPSDHLPVVVDFAIR